MDITDFIPINPIAEMFDIPNEIRWIMFFSIFIVGFISFKYFEKSYNIQNNIHSIDMLFLITIFGLFIILKSFFIVFFTLGVVTVPFSGTIDLYGLIFGMPFLSMISISHP